MGTARRKNRKARLKIDDSRKKCGYRIPNRKEKKEFVESLASGEVGFYSGSTFRQS